MSDESPDNGHIEPTVSEGESDIPWKPPVIAAILGALVVGIYVIYAIVTGPSVESDATDDPTSATVQDAEAFNGLPPGYVAVTDDVGARTEWVTTTPTATFVAVSTVVRGATDRLEVPPLDVAYWELATPSGSVASQDQFRWPGPTGTDGGLVTVAFPAGATSGDAELVAYVVASAIGEVSVLDLAPEFPIEVTDMRIDVGDGEVVVIESLTVEPDGGYVTWRVDGGLPARVDIVVTLAGTGGPDVGETVLLPGYIGGFSTDPFSTDATTPTEPVPVPYSFGAMYSLVPMPRLETGDLPTAVTVEFRVSVVTGVADPVSLILDR